MGPDLPVTLTKIASRQHTEVVFTYLITEIFVQWELFSLHSEYNDEQNKVPDLKGLINLIGGNIINQQSYMTNISLR